MSSEQKVRFGLVGAGGIAQAYVEAFGQSDAAELAGVADLRPEAAAETAAKAGCDSFPSHEAMCQSLSLDAVVVSTPPASHPEISIELLDRGLHVLCEKPFALDSASAREMFAVAHAAGTLLTMASKFRNTPDLQQAKSLIESGAIGDVMLVENSFTARVDMSQRWNSDPEISGGGVLIDNGTHSVDIVRYLFGAIEELRVVEGERYQRLPVDDTVRVFARTVQDVTAEIDLSWSINKQLPTYLNVFGSDGVLVVGWKESKFRRVGDDAWTVFGQGYDKVEAFRRQIDNFAAAVRGRAELIVSPADALASVDVIEAAYTSLNEGRWRTVNYTAHVPRLFVPDDNQTLVGDPS